MRPSTLAGLSLLVLLGCNAAGEGVAGDDAIAAAPAAKASAGRPFAIQPVTKFNEPWAMAFLPDGAALVTEKPGGLVLWANGRASQVSGVPAVDYGGQGGLGDVVIHPAFSRNGLVYLSWIEAGEGDTRGAVVGRGRLVRQGGAARLEGMQVIWRQAPKVEGRGHYGHRLAFAPDGKLFISNGDRQKFEPAQDMTGTLGKVVRLNDDGSVPRDNPWASKGGVTAQLWSAGHRNILGLAFDGRGQLWSHEMGPKNGDEFNRIERGSNYGYPIVSNGDHYDGKPIPDHSTRPEFNAPEVTWNGLSPAGLMIYSGSAFPQWRGSAFVGGLSGQALVRVAINGAGAREVERWDMGTRVREVEQGPDGTIYVLEDTRNGSGGRLLRLSPAR
ncbi:MAG TPA: PQQ-dependent sugar dehydrogenase [Allosphingosinicella sp.]|jgi:glucose/arabinose dehydrogenase|uniref:PQQ-dependent sugar dehydrogenase n=1 Tax=Allosphingosinicella sp. TaxID=2823234 RepID=UPI002F281DBB